jgi:hypothetical protein
MPVPLRVEAGVIWGIGWLSAVGYLVYFTVLQRRFRRRDAYAITTWRVIAASGLPGRRPCSAWLDQVAGVSVQRGRGAVATLAIRGPAPPPRWPAFPQGRLAPATVPEFPQLHDLADAAVAWDVLAQAHAAMRAGQAQADPPRPAPAQLLAPALVTLAPGEQLLWAGRPARVPVWFGWPDLGTTGAGLLAASVFAPTLTLPSEPPGANVAFFTVFAAVGLYVALGRVLYRWLRMRRAVYVLTSRRLIAAWGRTVAASDLRDLLPAQASGTSVTCRPVEPVQIRGLNGWRLLLTWPATTITPPVLAGLADPVAVRDLVRQAQLAARPGAGHPGASAG